MISTLLALLLIFSLMGGSAFADPVTVPGEATLTVGVGVQRDDAVASNYVDGEGNTVELAADEVYWNNQVQKVCNVTYVNRNGDEVGNPGSLTGLISQDIGIRIVPLEGFYVSGLRLGTSGGPGGEALYTKTKAHLYNSSVTLFLSDPGISAFDGAVYTLDSQILSSWDGADYFLNVMCSRIDGTWHTLGYDAGGHNAVVPEPGSGNGYDLTMTAVMPSHLAYDDDGTVWEFTGYRLQYTDGPWLDVEEQDEICLYTDATLIAQWRDVTEQYAQPDEQYTEEFVEDNIEVYTEDQTEQFTEDYVDPNVMYTMGTDSFTDAGYDSYSIDSNMVTAPATPVIPTVTIEGASETKDYDGTPLSNNNYTVTTGSLGEYIFEATYSEITEPGQVKNIQSYRLLYPDGTTQAFSQAELENSGNFTVNSGTLTVIPKLSIQGESYEKVYDGQPLTVPEGADGYTITGYIGNYYRPQVRINSLTEPGTADTLTNYELVDPDGNVVYDKNSPNITFNPGTLTVKPRPTIPKVTVEAPSYTKPFDGTPLTMDAGTDVTEITDDQGITYRIVLGYAGGSRTEIGTSENAVTSCAINDANNVPMFSAEEIQAARDSGRLTVKNGTLTVTDPTEKHPLVVTGITASVTVKAADQTVTFAECSAEGYKDGYKVTGLLDDHEIRGENIVSGQGTVPGFSTDVHADAIRVFNGETDVTALYSISAVNGYVTVTVETPDTPPVPDKPVVPTAKLQGVKESKKYDGEPLTKTGTEGYLVTGNLGIYHLRVEYNTITEVGSVDTLKNYELLDESNTVIFDKDALDDSPNFTIDPGKLIIEAADAPTVPPAVLIAVSDSKEYDGSPLTKSGKEGYELTGNLDGYDLVVTYGTITDVGSVDTLASYELQKDGKTVFTREDLDASTNFTVKNGKLTVTTPAPTIPKATLNIASGSKEYDGTSLTKEGDSTAVSVSGDLGKYRLHVEYNSITEPDTVDTLKDFSLVDENGKVAFTKEQLIASPNFTVNNGTLTVSKRPLKLIAISGTLNTKGENIVASSLSTQDGKFVNGYRQEGLMTGHTLSGNFVQGSGKESFKTSIDPEAVRITANGFDVTRCYSIQTQDGYITINAPTTYDLIVNPRSYTWTYDGMAHSMREYDYSGLVNGDKLVKVNFSDQATITNVGNQSNRITSVEVTTATGGDVDVNKYVLISTPGTLTVVQRDLTVTAISGSLTTNGTEVVASSLSTPDGTFKNGFKAEGLVPGHSLTGSFVVGRGTTTFNTSIDLNNLRVVDAYGNDVTRNYSIRTVNGTITINAGASGQQRSNVSLSITAKSGTFPYDGTEHKLNEYTANGLVDGDVIEKVTFKPSSVITDVGTRANEIQAVVIKSANGAAVDNSKYNINYYSGTLTVTKYPLTLTAVSDEKVYDGKALNNKSVKATALANSNHSLSADYEVFDSNGNTIKNGPVDPGVYTKRVSNVKITAGNTDVTANYDITMVDGTLKITGSSGESSRATTTTAYYGNTFTIRSDAPYAEFKYLLIDGAKVPTDNYTVKEGSTIITLKSSYIQSLKSGGHNYTIVSASKQIDGSFNVSKAPKTGDGASMIVWIILLLLAAVAVALVFFFLQRSGKLGGGKRRSGKRNGGKETLRYPSGKEYTRKPVAPVIPDLDFEPEPEPAQDDDPTMDLMKDFDLNLDDYRDPTPKTPSSYTGYTSAGYASEAASDSGKTGFEAPDFGSFDEPAAPQEEELPDLEVEIFEEKPTASTAAEPEAQPAAEPAEELPEQEVEAPVAEPEPEKAPEPARRRGKHEAPDPSDPFTDSWYQSVGLNKRDKNK